MQHLGRIHTLPDIAHYYPMRIDNPEQDKNSAPDLAELTADLTDT